MFTNCRSHHAPPDRAQQQGGHVPHRPAAARLPPRVRQRQAPLHQRAGNADRAIDRIGHFFGYVNFTLSGIHATYASLIDR